MGGKVSDNFYNLADNRVISVRKRSTIAMTIFNLHFERLTVLVGSSHGWLAYYWAHSNMNLFLYNPLSRRQIKLPSVKTIPLAEEILRDCWGRPQKLILSCSPDEEDCRAILCFGPRGNMAFCCPRQSTKWTPFGSHFHENEKLNELLRDACIVRAYDDFVYSTTQKQLFCITQFADIESWDLGDPTSPKLNWKKAGDDFRMWYSCKYLVFAEHSNRLFLVRRHIMTHMGPDGSPVVVGSHYERGGLPDTVPYKTTGFDVYEIDREKGEFIKYMDRTLDGMTFFIGSTGHGFVIEERDEMIKPNSIYFTDPDSHTPANWDKYKTYGGHDLGIFNYKNRTFSPCYYPCDIQKVERIQPTPIWFTPSPSPASKF
ncbi:PREDICTED: uncharacterized protein LOC105970537 [Erythranthe guttata]|nr:PREDICTED: uncharacterized protein LOC105970537 [Erythranthe guttata]|eukprot:XP_012850828.1 PREDICTED: uncharacterized protein LOC105970537 [Erythranthe guttata]